MKRLGLACAWVLAASGSAQLAPSVIATGKVAGELVAAANTNFNGVMSLTVSTVPVGATIVQAYFYASDWGSGGLMSPTFGGIPLTPSGAAFNDNNLYGYRWDVTAIVQPLGSANYSVNIPSVQQLFGCALAVVYSHPSLAMGRVQLNDGANALGDAGLYETGSTSFQNFGAGSGTLSIYTQGDDNSATGETVDFNGTTVHTGLDANLGATASLLNLNVSNVVAGTNTVRLSTSVPGPTTPVDVYGWHVAMLQQAQPVPEPFTSALALGGLLAAIARRRRNSA